MLENITERPVFAFIFKPFFIELLEDGSFMFHQLWIPYLSHKSNAPIFGILIFLNLWLELLYLLVALDPFLLDLFQIIIFCWVLHSFSVGLS